MTTQEPVRIFVGTDRSQMLGVKVLEYSCKRHTDLDVSVIPMIDLELPIPKDPRNRQRTGFSFSRFAIPQLAGYRGRAIYADADMQVFKDIREIWEMPFDGAKVICQEELPDHIAKMSKSAAPDKRTKQCSVMVLDCESLDWDPVKIVNGLDNDYDYAELMQQLCILDETDVNYNLPIRWNSLEHYDESTCLIHYTDMPTQPWVNIDNPNGWLFTNEIRRMLKDGVVTKDELIAEIGNGYVRPSFITELKMVSDSRELSADQIHQLNREDVKKGFVAHKELNELRRQFKLEIREFEKSLKGTEPQKQGLAQLASNLVNKVSGKRA
ncbi:MAG: glycosyltransferase [Pseudomonadota bacterium]